MSWNLPLQLSKLVRNPYNVDMNFLQDVDISKNLTVYGSANISGGIIVFMDLSDVLLDGNSADGQNIINVGTFSGINGDFSGSVDVSNNLTVYGNSSVSGDSTIFGNQDVSNNLLVYGNSSVSGDSTIFGNQDISNNLLVYDSVSILNDCDVSNNLTIFGQTNCESNNNVKGNLEVNGSSQLGFGSSGYTLTVNDLGSITQTFDGNFAIRVGDGGTSPSTSRNVNMCETAGNVVIGTSGTHNTNLTVNDTINTTNLSASGTVGLGATTINTSLTLSGYTTGDMVQSNSAGELQKLPIGSTGQFLTVSGGVAAWQTFTPTTETLQQTLTAGDDANNLNITNLNRMNVRYIQEQSSSSGIDISGNLIFINGQATSSNGVIISSATGSIISIGDGVSSEIELSTAGRASTNTRFEVVPATLKWRNSNPTTTSAVQSLRAHPPDAGEGYCDNFAGLTDGNNPGSLGWTTKNNNNSSYVCMAPSSISGIEKWSFTAQHQCQYEDILPEDASGLIVECVGNVVGLYDVPEYGINKNNFSNASPVVKLCETKKSKKILGVIKSITDTPNTTRGDLILQWNEDGYSKGDKRVQVNCIGEGLVWVVNTGGNIETGDLITSSNIAGYGEKQDDDLVHSYTLGKSTFDCDFIQEQIPKKKILKDDEGNNILDSEGRMIWVDSDELVNKYEMRDLGDGVKAVLISIVYYSG